MIVSPGCDSPERARVTADGCWFLAAESRLFGGWLAGVPPLDPITFGASTMLFALVGLAACYVHSPPRHSDRRDRGDQIRVACSFVAIRKAEARRRV
jgi:hypothetical protein